MELTGRRDLPLDRAVWRGLNDPALLRQAIAGCESMEPVGEGEGGAAGFARGDARVRLGESGRGTALEYAVKAHVGGRIAQVGSRLVDAAALELADDFFAAFERELSASRPAALR